MSDLVDAYIEWRRLKGYPPMPTHPIDMMIDTASGIDEEALIREFATDMRDIFGRLYGATGDL